MKWQDARKQHPDSWLLIEALKAHTTDDHKRIVEDVVTVKAFADFFAAMKAYKELHRVAPQREMYVIHTKNQEIDIEERDWVGLRSIAN